jgi:hypothetical protein
MTRQPKLLSVSNDAKTVKGESKGFLTGICYMSPANESGLRHSNGSEVNLCPFATTGCKKACLYTAGRAGIFPKINLARNARTRAYVSDYKSFCDTLAREIAALVRKAKKLDLTPCVRLNGTSDQPKLALELAKRFPEVQFYDYTKIPEPWKRTRSNYDLTFSLSEENLSDALDALAHKINVAVVFAVKRGHELPKQWNGYSVIDGDESDLRFADRKGVVVGLRAKGRAKKDESGFVQPHQKLIQIGKAA